MFVLMSWVINAVFVPNVTKVLFTSRNRDLITKTFLVQRWWSLDERGSLEWGCGSHLTQVPWFLVPRMGRNCVVVNNNELYHKLKTSLFVNTPGETRGTGFTCHCSHMQVPNGVVWERNVWPIKQRLRVRMLCLKNIGSWRWDIRWNAAPITEKCIYR